MISYNTVMAIINPFSRKDIPTKIPSYWDFLAFIIILSSFIVLAYSFHEMMGPYKTGEKIAIKLDAYLLPYYAMRSVMRMLIALIISFIATFTLGALAAKHRVAENIIIPSIDILQSVPILGFLQIFVWGFIVLFPDSMLGPECVAIFGIFTAQVWNMILSFYQSLKTLPNDIYEVATVYQLNPWKRFWKIEVPYAMPGLIWNTMMSLSAGWFMVVAAEAISTEYHEIRLPGIGSYIQTAVDQQNSQAILYAVITLFIVIFIYDQLIFKPINQWIEQYSGAHTNTFIKRSWVSRIFRNSKFGILITASLRNIKDRWINIEFPSASIPSPILPARLAWINALLSLSLLVIGCYLTYEAWSIAHTTLSITEVSHVAYLGFLTALRVMVLISLCTLIWLPVGVWIGMHPTASRFFQPIIQFLAAFPPNSLYPVAALAIFHYHLNVNIWCSPLMILGTQWYILFNVIAGAKALPKNLCYAAKSFHLSRRLWWQKLILPGLFPYIITGMITAAGGAWNASIIAEVVEWGQQRVHADGLGAYIKLAFEQGEVIKLSFGVIVMCVYVLIINRMVWKPLYDIAEKRFKSGASYG
jgi:NitT/TauT family transport system permease protein